MSRTTEGTRRRLLAALEASGHIRSDEMMIGLSRVIKGQKTVERYDNVGNLTSKEISYAPADVARGVMLLDALSGGELGLTPALVGVHNPVEEMYEQYAPTEFNADVIQNEAAREHTTRLLPTADDYGTD